MTVPMRLLTVSALAGVLYLSVILAGMRGFDPAIWAFYTVLFLVWHLLIHIQRPSIIVVMSVHGIVAAVFLGLGMVIGQWVGLAPPLAAPLVLGIAATALARAVRVSPEEAEEIAALADTAQNRIEAASPDTAHNPAPEPALPQEPDQGVALSETLDSLTAALDALPAHSPDHHDLVAAVTPAVGQAPLRDLVSALFSRARSSGESRDLQALTVLLTDPFVAEQSLGAGDADAAFHLISAAGDADAMAHWAMQSLSMLDHVPAAWADMPDDAALQEAAGALPFAGELLQEMIRQRPGDGHQGTVP